MTAPRLQTTGVVVAIGEGNVWIDGIESYPGDEGTRVPASPDEQRAWAELLMKPGAVRITIESASASQPEPLTGGPADIDVRVRVRLDWAAGSFMAGQTGTLIEYTVDEHAVVRLHDGHYYIIPNNRIERAPAECPHCGASRVTR